MSEQDDSSNVHKRWLKQRVKLIIGLLTGVCLFVLALLSAKYQWGNHDLPLIFCFLMVGALIFGFSQMECPSCRHSFVNFTRSHAYPTIWRANFCPYCGVQLLSDASKRKLLTQLKDHPRQVIVLSKAIWLIRFKAIGVYLIVLTLLWGVAKLGLLNGLQGKALTAFLLLGCTIYILYYIFFGPKPRCPGCGCISYPEIWKYCSKCRDVVCKSNE